ncbi:hypothetical protein B0H14DRAFT_977694 [Mycena olivaceomarginata]|nr:hypothetical protein B0H14DRAFT_977694 [Mycena olivaceomarginata]
MPGRRILSPAQMAILVEEDAVLPRASEDSVEEGEVVVARRVSVKKSGGGSAAAGVPAVPSLEKERRRSWIPRFSWLGGSRRNSRDVEAGEGEGEGQELLFDAGHGHSPSNSISALETPPRLVGQGASTAMATPGASGSGSGSGGATMREFGARALLPFLASRPQSGAAAGSRPMSGVSGPSGTSSDGTTGSGKSGGTVYTDARETLSTRGSRPSSRVRGWEGAEAPPPTPPLPAPQGHSQDPLDAPAPPALAAFAGSQTSLHRQQSREEEEDEELLHHSRDNSMSGTSHQQTATLAGSASNTTLATDTPLKPERAYAYGPPGLAFDALAGNNHGSFAPAGKGKVGSIGSWDKAGLELGFSRPASHSQLGTFGSANVVPVPIRVGGAPAAFGGVGGGHGSRSMFGGAVPEVRGGSAPHLSLDLDDAPPGAEGRWRLLGGGSAHSLLAGPNSSQEWGEGAGRRGTFGLSPAAQFHPSAGHSSEHGSFHSSSLSSGSSHAVGVAASSQHSLYPSSGSGGSARARLLTHAGSVEGPMSPTLSAFGHRARDAEYSGSSGSGGRRQENSSGSGSGAGEHVRSPLARAASPVSPLLSPWAGGLDPDWRPM